MAKKLYVGNLSFGTTEDGLKQIFAQHGEVTSVKIITDSMSGKSRGFGFVEMENADAAIEALNNQQYDGRTLTVNVAREKSEGGSRSGGGGGGFRGGRSGGDRGHGGGSRGGDRREQRW